MGVPSFFRWLGYRYPSIITYAYEKQITGPNGEQLPTNTLEPNPNGVEFDNLYLDMNGIIHPCCHPEEKLAPESLEEMIEAICKYIDRIFNIIRPRKLLYMAIDGVAPRAKMNQQRSRRFRSAIESVDANESNEKLRQQMINKGYRLAEKKKFQFDSNCITPGTEFMQYLSLELDKYIRHKIETDPGWQNIHIILSDANVPGEGEHKIMDFIRKLRSSDGYDPNTRHCLNGADADLIMLGLATHELHFTILREEFIPNRPKPCIFCEQYGHLKEDCVGIINDENGNVVTDINGSSSRPPELIQIKFLFVSLSVLREYLQKELYFYSEELNFDYNFERCIDDWIFLCFFVGNDFLPHLPSLEIRENAIDRLVKIYKELLPQLNDYITLNGFLKIENVQKLLKRLGVEEDAIFKERQRKKLQYESRMNQNNAYKRKVDDGNDGSSLNYPTKYIKHDDNMDKISTHSYFKLQTPQNLRQNQLSTFLIDSNKSSQNDQYNKQSTTTNTTTATVNSENISTNSNNTSTIDDKTIINTTIKTNNGDIELHKQGWRSRYYTQKFGINETDIDYNNFRNNVVGHYVQGLSWILQYYYQGCPSWSWYYPYHYAPFASDCIDIIHTTIDFDKNTTTPFKPMEQLMAVFPANSKKFLPKSWQQLMENPSSNIIDFYPTNFMIDLNGKKFSWQGVALLPFIDEKRLLDTLDYVYNDLTVDEQQRNSLKKDRLYFSNKNPIYNFIMESKLQNNDTIELINLYTLKCGNLSGNIYFDNKNIELLIVHCVDYTPCIYSMDYIFDTKLLPGVIPPECILKKSVDNCNRSYTPKLTLPNSNISHRDNPYRLDLNATSNIIRHYTTNVNRNNNHSSYYNPQMVADYYRRNFHQPNYNNQYPPHYNYPTITNKLYNNNDNHYYYKQQPTSYYAHRNRFLGMNNSHPSESYRNTKPTDPRKPPRS